MEEKYKNCEEMVPMVKQIDAEKTSMYQNFANKRLLIALISVIVGWIIYAAIFVVGYTVREQNWQNTTKQIVEMFTQTGGTYEIHTNNNR